MRNIKLGSQFKELVKAIEKKEEFQIKCYYP